MSEAIGTKKVVERLYSVDDILENLHPLLVEAINKMDPFDRQAAIASLEKIRSGIDAAGYDEGLEKGYTHSADDRLKTILDEGETV